MTGEGPVEAYLDRLVVLLSSGDPRSLRHLLAETEAHLRDSTDRGVAEGLGLDEAEARAVQRFGPVEDFVSAERARQVAPWSRVGRQIAASAVLLGAIGALAVGLSGIVAAAFWAIGGTSGLVAVTPGRQLAGSDCARWLRLR